MGPFINQISSSLLETKECQDLALAEFMIMWKLNIQKVKNKCWEFYWWA